MSDQSRILDRETYARVLEHLEAVLECNPSPMVRDQVGLAQDAIWRRLAILDAQRHPEEGPMVRWSTYAGVLDAYSRLLGSYTSLFK